MTAHVQISAIVFLFFFIAITHFKFTEIHHLLREHVLYVCRLVSSKIITTNNFMLSSNADVDINGDNGVSRFNRKRTHLTLLECDLNNSPCAYSLR